MELRKDPITRSWVVVGHPDEASAAPDGCLLCPGHEAEHAALLTLPPQGPWQIRVVPHFNPLYRIEGEPGRQADGIYDRMRPRSEEHTSELQSRPHLVCRLLLEKKKKKKRKHPQSNESRARAR